MKSSLAVLLLFFALTPSVTFPQPVGNRIEVRLASQKIIEVKPGRIVTASYLAVNHSENEEEVVENLELPRGWQPVLSYNQPLTLAPYEQKVRLIAYVVPNNSRVGRYEVVYSVRGRQDAGLRSSASMSVVVLPVLKIDSQIENQPYVVVAGNEYEIDLRLVNEGNSALVLNVDTRADPDYPVTIDSSRVVLAPGERRKVRVVVSTTAMLKHKIDHILNITTQVVDAAGALEPIQRTVVVPILPRTTVDVDLRHRVPTRLKLLFADETDDNGYQLEYSGDGSLDKDERNRVRFLFRGPDLRKNSALGTRDVFRFQYSNPSVDVTVGDRAYSLSLLSEGFVYGRGAEANIHAGRMDYGAYFVDTRWSAPEGKRAGAYASYRHNEVFRFKGNFLHKRESDTPLTGRYNANIFTVQSRITMAPELLIGWESAYSVTDEMGQTGDHAHGLNIDGRLLNRTSYTFETIYAGDKFSGYYNDTFLSAGAVASPIYRNLRGNLSYRLYEKNLDSNPTRNTAVRERSYEGAISYSFATGTYLSLEYKAYRREDELSPTKSDFLDNVWKFELGHSFKKIGFQTFSERGVHKEERLSPGRVPLERYTLLTFFRPTSRQSHTLYTRIGHNSYTVDPEWTKSFGVSSSLRINDFLRSSISYQKSNYGSRKNLQQDYFFSTLGLILPNGHNVDLTARILKPSNRSDTDYSILATYTVPFSLPVRKNRDVGVLRGKVFDGGKEGSASLANVILSTDGVIAVTDQDGEFVFPSLKPGIHTLQVNRRSIGYRKILGETLPVQVEVVGGNTVAKEMFVVTAAKISGKVGIYALKTQKQIDPQLDDRVDLFSLVGAGDAQLNTEAQNELVEAGGAQEVLVEISRGKEVLQQLTNKQGRFSFEHIRPGEWTLKVYNYNLPEHHYLENSKYKVLLAEGERKKIVVRILPRRRSIQIIENEELRIQE